MKFFWRWVLLLCISSQVVWADEPALLFPPMTGRVVDAAQLLDISATVRLSRMLQEHEQATGEQVVVVTLVDLQGTTIEDYGTRLGKTWNLGQSGKNNGALLIVSRDNRKAWIEAGKGLHERLSEAQAALIINMLIAPEFRDGNFAVGIERGAQAMITALGGHVPDAPEAVHDNPYTVQHGTAFLPVAILLAAVAVLLMAISAMSNGGRRLRCKRRTGDRQDLSGSRVIGASRKGFAGGGASGHW